ncbi:MAG: SGNH/GDSL hydrolase family protein [Akkermansiaceae bacterium]|nr:SGNH/GDSL hydrolase family protein [Armatimonadota bacterium]
MRILPIASDRRYYVSLGDAQSRNADNHVGAASQFYGRLAALDSQLKMVPLATEGATAASVRYVQLPRLREMNVQPSVVTLTLGASDLSRLAFGGMEGVCRELREHGDVILTSLRTSAPHAVLLFSTLYDPMDGADASLATGIRQFNHTLRTLVRPYGGVISDLYTAFSGHGASVGDPLSPLTISENPDLYLCAGADLVPVPNQRGAAVFAELLLRNYHAAFTEETPLVSDFTTGGLPL